jgi:hypothetical protein
LRRIAVHERKGFQNGRFACIVATHYQIHTTEILELYVFEPAEILEFKMRNHLVCLGRIRFLVSVVKLADSHLS